jgi:DNA-directed RNA polymerase III subunit RPC8
MYANRVLHEVGLCISVFDLADVGEGRVSYGDDFCGIRYVSAECFREWRIWRTVTFRVVVFRPFFS